MSVMEVDDSWLKHFRGGKGTL